MLVINDRHDCLSYQCCIFYYYVYLFIFIDIQLTWYKDTVYSADEQVRPLRPLHKLQYNFCFKSSCSNSDDTQKITQKMDYKSIKYMYLLEL